MTMQEARLQLVKQCLGKGLPYKEMIDDIEKLSRFIVYGLPAQESPPKQP